MANFSEDIENFEEFGTYTYKYDETGNLTFNSSSEDFSRVYLSLPLTNFSYNKSKIDSFYNVNFEEFVPQSGSVEATPDVGNLESQLFSVTRENMVLKEQLEAVIAVNETSGSVAEDMATREVILELRKALGQGRVDSDFIDEFPYTPKRKVAR